MAAKVANLLTWLLLRIVTSLALRSSPINTSPALSNYSMKASPVLTTTPTRCPIGCGCTVRSGIHVVTCERQQLRDIPANIPINTDELYLGYNSITKVNNFAFKDLVKLKVLSLKNNQLYELEPGAFSRLSELQSLFLTKNVLSKIDGNVFKGLSNLTNLYLTQNRLSEIPDLGYATMLRKLNLDNNMLKSVAFPEGFINLTNLKSITLNNNHIGILRQDDFKVFSNTDIAKLDLVRCGLTTIENNTFSHVKNLVSLRLAYNAIRAEDVSMLINGLSDSRITALDLSGVIEGGSLAEDTFKALDGVPLQQLFLSHSNIGVLRARTFQMLKTLQTLDLSYAGVTATDNEAFIGLSQLKTLLLYHNRMQLFPEQLPETLEKLDMSHNLNVITLTKETLKNLVKLKELHMHNCALRTIRADSFVDTPNLHLLDISNNEIAGNNIPAKAFRTNQQLNILDLSNNKMVKFETDYSIFYNLVSLKVLNLSGNGCERIPAKVFWQLTRLEKLDVRDNHLSKDIEDDTGELFHQLENVQELYISNNRLRLLPSVLFERMKSLVHLDLSRNDISHWQEDVFNVSSLLSLDLSSNQISVINSTSFNLGSNLSWLNLANNPFSCYCDLIWFRNWVNKTDVTVSGLKQYRCSSPPDMEGKLLVDFDPLSIIDDCKVIPLAMILSVTIGIFLFLFVLVVTVVYRNRWKLRLRYYRFKKRYAQTADDEEQLVTTSDYRYDAFISVSDNPRDENWVRDMLLPRIQRPDDNYPFLHGEHSLFHISKDLPAGSGLMTGIAEAIEASRKVIIVVSQYYFQQPQKRDYELGLALQKLAERGLESIILVIMDIEALVKIPSGPLQLITDNNRPPEWSVDDEERQEVFWEELESFINSG